MSILYKDYIKGVMELTPECEKLVDSLKSILVEYPALTPKQIVFLMEEFVFTEEDFPKD